jgi:hypothetical protein
MVKDRHTQFVDIKQVNAAFRYLTEPKKPLSSISFFFRNVPLLCIGRGAKTRAIIQRMSFPELPLFADNKELRESLKPRAKSPLFRVVASTIAFKAKGIKDDIRDAINQEKNKQMIYPQLFALIPAENEELHMPLTWEEYYDIIKP